METEDVVEGGTAAAKAAYFGEADSVTVSDPIAFTSEPYSDVRGESTIAQLWDLVPQFSAFWYGFSAGEPYPVQGDCDPQHTRNETIPQNYEELPAVIEGVVTLHPRYFMKVTVCGTEERYYGSYIIQDETGGIFVLKDSRIADFDVGDRVRLRVRSMLKNFSTVAVLGFDQEEVLTDRNDRVPLFYETPTFIDNEGVEQDRNFRADRDLFLVRRIRGRVEVEATNQNFNEMVVRSERTPGVRWYVSLDREIGTRGVAPKQGDLVELTGPVVDSFGLRMIVASLGKINVLESAE